MNIKSDIILYANESRFDNQAEASRFLVLLSVAIAHELNMLLFEHEPTLSAIAVSEKSKDYVRLFTNREAVVAVYLSDNLAPLQRQIVMYQAGEFADAHNHRESTTQ